VDNSTDVMEDDAFQCKACGEVRPSTGERQGSPMRALYQNHPN